MVIVVQINEGAINTFFHHGRLEWDGGVELASDKTPTMDNSQFSSTAFKYQTTKVSVQLRLLHRAGSFFVVGDQDQIVLLLHGASMIGL